MNMDAKMRDHQDNTIAERSGDTLFVESVRKGFAVLDALNEVQRPMTLAEIAEHSGLGRSAAQRFVHTLREMGFLRQDPKTKAYMLTPKILSYSRTFFSSNTLCARAEPILRDLALETGETVNLSELNGTDIIYTVRFPSTHSVSVNLAIGARLPAFNTASGRAILAKMPRNQAQAILSASDRKQWTPNTKTEMADLLRELDEIGRNGFCLSDQEAFLGDISVAAPVVGHDGKCSAAVNIAVPTPRWSKERVVSDLMPKVIETAARVSREFGHD